MGSHMVSVNSQKLHQSVTEMFRSLGVAHSASELVADALVEADEQGIHSHGVMLVPMYADRLIKGSVSKGSAGRVVSDRGATAVIDADNVLGQLTAHQCVDIAADKAAQHGLAAVAVRNAFHFGMAGRYALELSRRGFVGMTMCNTRPLMPAPGGAEPITGNNPLAIAVPSNADGPPVVLDMATSASAMGKIRVADSTGQSIPEGWATDSQGRPTTDPAAAIKGMLLPAAGPKGFGLAFIIDLMCGALSDGAIGPGISPLYGDPAEPYRCAHFFLAVDVEHFRDMDLFTGDVAAALDRLHASMTAPGIDEVMSPGEPAWRQQNQNPGRCELDQAIIDNLNKLAAELQTQGVAAAGDSI